MTDETPQFMYYASDHSDTGLKRVEMTPAVIAQVDQERAFADDALTTLITYCVMDTLYDHLGDEKRREKNASEFSQLLLAAPRAIVLGILTIAAESLAAYYVHDKGGIEATLKRVHDEYHEEPRDQECPFPKLHEE